MIELIKLDKRRMKADYKVTCDGCKEELTQKNMSSWNNFNQHLIVRGWLSIKQGKKW